jgi:hypothetical protein
MVAYYEHPEAMPPAHLLPATAMALGVTIDQLHGRGTLKRRLAKQEGDSRLRRRLLAIEKLDATEKRQVLQLIDAFIERGQLRSKVHAGTRREEGPLAAALVFSSIPPTAGAARLSLLLSGLCLFDLAFQDVKHHDARRMRPVGNIHRQLQRILPQINSTSLDPFYKALLVAQEIIQPRRRQLRPESNFLNIGGQLLGDRLACISKLQQFTGRELQFLAKSNGASRGDACQEFIRPRLNVAQLVHREASALRKLSFGVA